MTVRARPLRLALFTLLLLSTLSACAPKPSPGEESFPEYRARPLPTQHGALFATSGVCANCHASLTDEAGNDVSVNTDWRAAIMANASRDPYWQASVRAEVLDHPALRAIIEDKCATCHTPMARFATLQEGAETLLLDGGVLDPDHPLHTSAMDGVSCTLCHQIEARRLGDPESFSGGFSIDTQRPRGERLAYGPYVPLESAAAVMRDLSGYRPVEGPHTLRSELCATCHTLYTPYIDDEGHIGGTFPEQVPYLEWQHSEYPETKACQDCHMLPAEGNVRGATMGSGPPRSPFSRHLFIGGNVHVLRMLRAFGETFDVTASSDQFTRKIEQTLEQLQTRTATLAVEEVSLSGSRLTLAVTVRVETGHKFPTAFPSRRAWLHLTVEDPQGNVHFRSGAVGADGAIAGNDNDADPTAYEPHHQEIAEPHQVQIYEAILADISGKVTTQLLRTQGYHKDNRLLPAGFDKASAGEDFRVHGRAAEDGDFAGGGDTVRYHIDLPDAGEALTVTVELLYQSIGYRWAESMRRYEGDEIDRFLEAYDAVPNQPVTIDTITVDVAR